MNCSTVENDNSDMWLTVEECDEVIISCRISKRQKYSFFSLLGNNISFFCRMIEIIHFHLVTQARIN
jgi:hypothetical protein